LADVFLATFGGYPSEDDIGKDYGAFFRRFLDADETVIPVEAPVIPTARKELTPSILTTLDLLPVDHARAADPGFYYGQIGDFTDLINFWNLRASRIDLLFYDSAYRERLGG